MAVPSYTVDLFLSFVKPDADICTKAVVYQGVQDMSDLTNVIACGSNELHFTRVAL